MIPRVAAATVSAIGLAALAGWRLDVTWLTGFLPGHATMNPATAIALVLLGLSLALATLHAPAPPHWLPAACAVPAALIGLVRVTGYLWGFDPGIDRLLVAPGAAATVAWNPVARHTALTLVVLGSALVLLDRPTRRAQLAVQLLTLAAAVGALVSVTGHLYGTRWLSGTMSLNTALAVLLLVAGVLWHHPDGGVVAWFASPTSAGVMARVLFPAVILVPLLLGWLGLAGQRAGWYDTAGGTALFVASMIVTLAAFVWWSARSLSHVVARRSAAELALRASEERFRLLVASIGDYAVFMLDSTGRITSWNPGAERLKGYTAEEIVGRHFSCFYAAEAIAAGVPQRALEIAVETGRFEEVNWRVRKDGTRFRADVVIAPVRDGQGQLIGFAKVTRDLTERQRVEEALRTSEEQFRTLASTANDAIVSADSRGQITYLNPAAERIFGYGVDEAIGRPLTTLMPERFHAAHVAGLTRYVATGDGRVVGRTVELVGRHREGREFPVELSLASWKRGPDVAFTAIIRDITERKRGDETLRRYAAQLESANAELDAFAYSVSHDLRAPLRSLDGFSQALLEDYAHRLDAQGTDYLQRVRLGSQRMGQLIDDLLNLSRVTRSPMHQERVDLSALAQEIAAELRKGEPSRQVEFAITPDLVVEADRGLMELVLQNLLGNAWKFTSNQPRALIELGTTRHDGAPAYFVRDNGAGFDMAYAAKLFGAFQRLHTSTEFPGSGIGLATVQRIILRHGGRVWADAQAGRGATFHFTLS